MKYIICFVGFFIGGLISDYLVQPFGSLTIDYYAGAFFMVVTLLIVDKFVSKEKALD